MNRSDLIELAAYAKIDKNYDVYNAASKQVGDIDGIEKTREGYAAINSEIQLKIDELQGTSLEDILAKYRSNKGDEA